MTYSKKSPQRLFVTGRYTLTLLLVGAALLWIAGWLLNIGGPLAHDISLPYSLPLWAEHIISFCIYIAVAFILNSFIIIEGRTPWMGGIMMWLTGLLFSVQEDMSLSLSLFMLIMLVSILLSCYNCDVVEHRLFVTFMAAAVCTILFPQFAYILPFIVLYPMATSLISFKGLVASLLGFITPSWLYLGTATLLSQFAVAWGKLCVAWDGLWAVHIMEPSTMNIAVSALEVATMILSVFLFIRGVNPTKPLMRRTLLFFVLLNIYLWVLSIFKTQDACMLMAWRLPGLAAMSAYIFSFKFTKLFNIYFVILNIGWMAIAILGLWNGL